MRSVNFAPLLQDDAPAGAAPVAEVKPPKAAKKAARKPAKKAAKKKVAKKAKSVKAKKASTPRGESIRSKVFRLINKHANGLTGAQIVEKLSLQGVPKLLKDEGVCDNPRIKRLDIEGVRGVTYQLTARGKKHVAEDKVDVEAAPDCAGKDWK